MTDQDLFQHAAKLRMNGISDHGIVYNFEKNGLTKEMAEAAIRVLDDSNVSAESNSKPSGLGWLSIIVAIGVTLFVALGIGMILDDGSIRLSRLKIFGIPAVIAGFVTHVAITLCMERAGIKTSAMVHDPSVTRDLRLGE